MTPAQKRAMRPYRKELKQNVAEAALTAATPGKARTWFVPFLTTALTIYRKLTTECVDSRPLSRALAKDPRVALFKLLRPSGRDRKTRSRWAAALLNAYQSNVSPAEFPTWLKKGGGVAGRAAELAKATRARKLPVDKGNDTTAKLSPEPSISPEPKNNSPEATSAPKMNH